MRGYRLFGEPMHPPLVHVPLATMVTLPLWDALGILRGEPIWWEVGFWTLALGLSIGSLAAVAGFLDYTRLPAGDPAVRTATRHLVAMLSGVGLFLLRLILQGRPGVPEQDARLLLAVSLVGALVVTVGGFLGGRLVYRHGVGVEAGE